MKVYNGSAWQAVEFDPDSLEVSLIPSVDNTYDLGSTTKEWRNLYIDGTANIDSLVADTADINGGTLDGVVIGGASAAAATFTTATATTGNITTVNATTVDSTNVEVTNLKAKDGTASATIADVTGVMTVASAVLTTADINGGTADAVVIGGATPAAGTFTSLNATGGGALTGTWSNLGSVTTIDINGGTIDGAVIGGSSAAAGTFTDLTSNSSATLKHSGSTKLYTLSDGVGITGTMYSDLMEVNGTAIIEATSASAALRITQLGSGNALLVEDSSNPDSTPFVVTATGSVGIGNTSPATALDVTGTITADGLTVDGDITVNDASPTLSLFDTDGTNQLGQVRQVSDRIIVSARNNTAYGSIYFTGRDASTEINRMIIDGPTGDISFYEDTGTTAKFFWDASAESLGIGTTSPSSVLHLSTSNDPKITLTDTGFGASADITGSNGNLRLNSQTATIFDMADSEVARIDSSGRVGIGTTTVTESLDANGNIKLRASTAARYVYSAVGDSTTVDAGHKYDSVSDYVATLTGGSEKMRVDSSGNLLLGITTDPLGSRLALSRSDDTAFGLGIWGEDTSTEYLAFGVPAAGESRITAGGVGTTSNALTFHTSASGTEAERMRIDSSGNLLVGKTIATATDLGAQIESDGQIKTTSNNQSSLTLNRKTSDGEIAIFQKDGTAVGSIASSPNAIIFGSGDVNLKFLTSSPAIYPRKANDTTSDGYTDLGLSSNRFKDLYLAGGAYLGGTTSSNLLNDYEEGTFTPTIPNLTIGNGTQAHIYTKVGNKVTIEGIITLGSTSSISGALTGTVPFTPNATHRAYGKSYLLDNGAQNYVGTVIVNEAGGLQLLADAASASYLYYSNLSSTVPFTWTTGDVIRYSITYIAA